jgi:hypothetical protein
MVLVPILRRLHLPVSFDWKTFGIAYLILGAQSVFVAVLLYLIGVPWRMSLKPLIERYRHEPVRIVLVLLYLAALGWTLTWVKAGGADCGCRCHR